MEGRWVEQRYKPHKSCLLPRPSRSGGDREIRTLDICLARAALSQLSYIPVFEQADRFSDYICLFVSCADSGSTQATLIVDAQPRKLQYTITYQFWYVNSYFEKKKPKGWFGVIRPILQLWASLSAPICFFFCYHSIFLTSIHTIVMFSLGDRISRFYSWFKRQFAMQIEISCVNMSNVIPCTVDVDIGYANA